MGNFPGVHIEGRTFSDSREEKKTTPRVMASKVVRELSLALLHPGSLPVHTVCIQQLEARLLKPVIGGGARGSQLPLQKMIQHWHFYCSLYGP